MVRNPPASKVFLFGVDHLYQWQDECCEKDDLEAFKNEVLHVCQRFHVASIMEEMSSDALAAHGRSDSLPAQIAKTLDLVHCYCDPTRDEQQGLKIADENAVRALSMLRGLSDERIDELVFAERRKREPVWIERMQTSAAWPALFICGYWHIPSFASLLQRRGYEVTTVHAAWTLPR